MVISLLSSIFNITFEVAFIWYQIFIIKNIKNKRIKLFFGILTSYMLSSILIGFIYNKQIYMLIMMAVFIYMFMKLLYKNKIQIIDLFFIYYSISVIAIMAMITTLTLGYNIQMHIINRIILVVINFMLPKLTIKLYNKCIQNWNRKNGNKIKSVTLRNIFIISTNILIFIINCYIINYLQYLVN